MPPTRRLPLVGGSLREFRASNYTSPPNNEPPRSRPHSDIGRYTSRTPQHPYKPASRPLHSPDDATHNAHAEHEHRILAVIARSVAKRTAENHSSAIRTFQAFCKANKFTPLPANDFTLCAYAAHLASSMAGSSIANAISGIKSWHIANNESWNGTPRLQMVIKGAVNLTPASSRAPARAPVTAIMLESLAATLSPNDAEDRAILAVALVAFWGQCRLGELLGTSSRVHDPNLLPSRSSLSQPISVNGSRSLHLPCTKTSQNKGESIVITAQSGPTNPIAALSNHLRSNPPISDSSHLFAFHHAKSGRSKLLTRNRFLDRCNAIWLQAGFDKISGHAFRIGGTTGLLKAGVAPEIVKVMGRWGSDAYFRYWRDTQAISIQHAEHLVQPTLSARRPALPAADTNTRAPRVRPHLQGSRP